MALSAHGAALSPRNVVFAVGIANGKLGDSRMEPELEAPQLKRLHEDAAARGGDDMASCNTHCNAQNRQGSKSWNNRNSIR